MVAKTTTKKKTTKKEMNENNHANNLLDSLTPAEITAELDKYIIGQENAKKSVAIALRNRARRKMVDSDIKDEIAPKNIIMIGPTGVGKTEIARRLSKLSGAPFIKVEATKYTEVGYVGRDVESMIRDLVNMSVNLVRYEMRELVRTKAEKNAEDIIVDLLMVKYRKSRSSSSETKTEMRNRLRKDLKAGNLEEDMVKITISQPPMPFVEVLPSTGFSDIDADFQNIINSIMPPKDKEKSVSVKEARKILVEEEYDKLIDIEKLNSEAISRTEEMGIVFIDEIDKLCASGHKLGPDISREGVQRDILPIVEGSAIHTRYGMVRSDHILFIAAGAFHTSKPSDLIPELQGRFPIRVELDSLSKEDLKSILTQPKNALTKQYEALLATEGIQLSYAQDAVDEIAEIAWEVNAKTENIGARRLHTIMEKLLEDISFNAPNLKEKVVTIDKKYVVTRLKGIIEDRDMSRYIL